MAYPTIGDKIHLTCDEERALCAAIQTYGDASHPWPDATTLRGFALHYVIGCAKSMLAVDAIPAHLRGPAATALAKLEAPTPSGKRTATALATWAYPTCTDRRLAYAITDGPDAGHTFYAYDKPTPGQTVTVEYHPDDQFARIRPRVARPTLEELIRAAGLAIGKIADETFHAAGCNRESGDREQALPRKTPTQCAAILESLASFLSCIAKDDLKTRDYVRFVSTLSGLTNGVASDLGMDPDVVGEPVSDLVVRLTRDAEAE